MALHILFNTFLNDHQMLTYYPNVKCFCDDVWETLLLLKSKEGLQTSFSFVEKITFESAC